MKLIIDIDSEDYDFLKDSHLSYNMDLLSKQSDKDIKGTLTLLRLVDSVKNGTPLPKGHGDLIDRDELLADSYPIDDWNGNEVNIVDVMTVEMADAIIEAESEE